MQQERGGERKREGGRVCDQKRFLSHTHRETDLSLSPAVECWWLFWILCFPLLLREKGKFLLLSFIFFKKCFIIEATASLQLAVYPDLGV